MEPSLPISLTQDELSTFNAFWHSLSEEDREAMTELIRSVEAHRAVVDHSSYYLPYHVWLLALLMELHKKVKRLEMMVGEPEEKRS